MDRVLGLTFWICHKFTITDFDRYLPLESFRLWGFNKVWHYLGKRITNSRPFSEFTA